MNTFKTAGTGNRKVLLLPGLFGTQEAFNALMKFADLSVFQYVTMEYRGYGNSKNVKGLYTLTEIVADAVKLIDYLGWAEFTVAGHSIGALAAQMLAAALPARVKAIVSLAGLSALGGSRDPDRRRLLDEAATDFNKRVAIINAGAGHQYSASFAAALAQESWDAIHPEAITGYARSASQTDIHQEIKGSTVPIMVIVGENDPANTATIARQTTMQWYKNSLLQVIPQVGHYPMIEAPARTISALEKFIKSQPGLD